MRLTLAAIVFLVLGGLLQSARDRVLVGYGRLLIASGVIFVVIAWSVGCSSPTQPSETRYLWSLTAKGCTPIAGAPVPSGAPLLEISGTTIAPMAPMANGRDVVLVQWANVNAIFLAQGPFYALCSWWRP